MTHLHRQEEFWDLVNRALDILDLPNRSELKRRASALKRQLEALDDEEVSILYNTEPLNLALDLAEKSQASEDELARYLQERAAVQTTGPAQTGGTFP